MTTNNGTMFDFEDGNGPVPAHKHSNGGGWIADSAYVDNIAYVGPFARVFGNAIISGFARIFGDVIIVNNVRISGNARVYDNAYVSGNARVYDDARVCQNMWIQYGNVDSDLTDKANIKQNIFAQTGLTCEDDYVICYKKVNNNLTSIHDENFQYVIGEWAEVKNSDMSNKSCASGLHFSHKEYWNICNILLECKIILEDIITVQQGKIRTKKCFVIGKVE